MDSGEALLFCLLSVGCARESKTDMPSFHSLAFSLAMAQA